MKIISYPVLTYFRQSIAFWKTPRIFSFVFWLEKMSVEHWWSETGRGKLNSKREIFPNSTLSIAYIYVDCPAIESGPAR
jgi:hypothetical protein